MPVYMVKAVRQTAEGEGKSGPWTRQKVRLQPTDTENAAFTDATMFCNKFTPVPKEGDTLDGDIEPAEREGWLPNFKPARKGGGFGGGPRPEDPKRMASIAMQSSQKLAWEVVRFSLEHGLLKFENPYDEMLSELKHRSAEIYAQVKGAQDAV